MCVAVPAEIIKIYGEEAAAGLGGNTRRVSIALTPGVKVGDFVLIHAGYALERIDPAEAREVLMLLEEAHEAVAE